MHLKSKHAKNNKRRERPSRAKNLSNPTKAHSHQQGNILLHDTLTIWHHEESIKICLARHKKNTFKSSIPFPLEACKQSDPNMGTPALYNHTVWKDKSCFPCQITERLSENVNWYDKIWKTNT